MADEVDLANDFMDVQVSRALRLRQVAPQKPGAHHCKECEEKMPDARRQLGFQLCFECAEEAERRKSLFADY